MSNISKDLASNERNSGGRGLSLVIAEEIAHAALRHGEGLRVGPLTVAVLDAGGTVMVLLRQEGSGLLRPQIAIAKAWGVLGMGLAAHDIGRRSASAPQFYASLTVISEGRFLAAKGGVPIVTHQDALVGAVGISGDTGANDERCAQYGIEAAGLKAWMD